MNLSTYKIAFILIILSIQSVSCGSNDSPISVAGREILFESNAELEAASGSGGWHKVIIPSTFKTPYPDDRTFRSVWLRGSFKILKDPSVYYGLSVG